MERDGERRIKGVRDKDMERRRGNMRRVKRGTKGQKQNKKQNRNLKNGKENGKTNTSTWRENKA